MPQIKGAGGWKPGTRDKRKRQLKFNYEHIDVPDSPTNEEDLDEDVFDLDYPLEDL